MKTIKYLKSSLSKFVNYRLRLVRGRSLFHVPVVAGVGRAHLDNHEPHVAEILRRLIRLQPDSMLVDIGANIGQTLVQFATAAGKSCSYIGFEPNIQAAAYVEKLIDLNEFKNAYLIAAGLGSSFEIGKLLISSRVTVDPGASLNPKFRDSSFYNTYKYAQILCGDDVLAALTVKEKSLIIKIDVEGSELEVLRGLKKTIENRRPVLIVEILPPAEFSDEVAKYRLLRRREILEYMSSWNYSGTQIDQTNDYLFLPVDSVITSHDLL